MSRARDLSPRERDLFRGMCPDCDGGGCQRCDYTGFRPDQRTFSIGYGWRRRLLWPWHYVQHVQRGRLNGWYSILFCTWCIDDRLSAPQDDPGAAAE